MRYPWCPAETPGLSDGRVALRAFRPDDRDAWFAWATDPDVYAQTSDTPPESSDVWPGILDQLQEWLASGEQIRWAISEAGQRTAVGIIGFNHLNPRDLRGEIGYSLARTAWGRGLATAAGRLAVRYGFEVLRLRRIEATVMAGNERSTRVLEKLGFQREGCMRQYKLARGVPHDYWMYGLLAEDQI